MGFEGGYTIRNIDEIFRDISQKYPNYTFIWQPTEQGYLQITYQQAWQKSQALAGRLAALKLPAGSRVVLISETRLEWMIAFLAAAKLGLVVVPLDPQLTPFEWAHFIAHAEPAVLIVSANFASVMERLQKASPLFRAGIYFGTAPNLPAAWHSYEQWTLPMEDAQENPKVRVGLSDVALIVYTSGTYGTPHAVELTQENLIFSGENLARVAGGAPGHVFLSISPLHHIYGFTGAIASLSRATAYIIFSSIQREILLRSFLDLKPYYVIGVPTFYERIGRSIEEQIKAQAPRWIQKRLMSYVEGSHISPPKFPALRKWLFRKIHQKFGGRIRLLASGGAALDPRCNRLFNALGFRMVEGYGLSETTAMVTRNDPQKNKIGSIGKPVKGMKVRVDMPGEEGIGELCFKGPLLMKGYFQNPEATQKAFDREGWFHTGDLGQIDADGFVYFRGRRKDVIVTANGKNIYPEELEHYFSQIPLIKELCVFGLPVHGGSLSEKIHLQIFPDEAAVKEKGSEAIQTLLREKVADLSAQLAEYKRPMSLGFSREPFPHTTTLKVKKGQVREGVLRELQFKPQPAAQEKIVFDAGSWEANFIMERVGKLLSEEKTILPTSDFALDLGLASLDMVELWANLEKTFQVSIPTEEVVQWRCVQDILNYIHAHPEILQKANVPYPSLQSTLEVAGGTQRHAERVNLDYNKNYH